MKIAYINPPSYNQSYIREGRCTQSSSIWSLIYPPLSLAQIASYIADNISVINFGYDFAVSKHSFQEACHEISNKNFDLIFIATGTPSINSDLDFCRIIKEQNVNTRIVLIGTHVSHYAKGLIRDHSYIDYIIHGEPERPALNIAKAILQEKPLEKAGITTKDFSSNSLLLIEDLDILPFPAWELFDLNNYTLPIRGHKFLLMSPQRGCPWKCTFCTAPLYYGNKIRSKTPNRIKEEITYIKNNFNISNFLFWSDTFTANKRFVLDLCYTIKDLDISWVSNSRVDTIDYDLALEMKKAGCWMLTYGIESLDDEVLKSIKKGITTNQISTGVKAAQDAGIMTIGHFIVGLPHDTPKSIKASYIQIRKLNLDYLQFYYATPFPGTELHRNYIEDNIIDDNPLEEFSQSLAKRLEEYQTLVSILKIKSLLRIKTLKFVLRNFIARFS